MGWKRQPLIQLLQLSPLLAGDRSGGSLELGFCLQAEAKRSGVRSLAGGRLGSVPGHIP